MKTEHLTYLENLGISRVISSRIESIMGFYTSITPEDILDIFISEYLQEDGSRMYESLWLFSEHYAMEAKNFITSDNFDRVYLSKQVGRWQIEKTEYDFVNATDSSRMIISFSIEESGLGITGKLKSSKQNCDSLKNIFLNYVLKNQTGYN